MPFGIICSNLISSNLIQSNLISYHVVSFEVVSSNLISYELSFYLICHLWSSDFIWKHLDKSDLILYDLTWSYPLWFDLLRYRLISSDVIWSICSNPILSDLISSNKFKYFFTPTNSYCCDLISYDLFWFLIWFYLIWCNVF